MNTLNTNNSSSYSNVAENLAQIILNYIQDYFEKNQQMKVNFKLEELLNLIFKRRKIFKTYYMVNYDIVDENLKATLEKKFADPKFGIKGKTFKQIIAELSYHNSSKYLLDAIITCIIKSTSNKPICAWYENPHNTPYIVAEKK